LLKAEFDSDAIPEWAGEYYFGDGLGVNVRALIAPQGGFIFSWTGCLGLYDVNFGSVRAQDDRLTLQFELPNKRGHKRNECRTRGA
jgi:hypothetical protein